jgi:hypothetical protein
MTIPSFILEMSPIYRARRARARAIDILKKVIRDQSNAMTTLGDSPELHAQGAITMLAAQLAKSMVMQEPAFIAAVVEQLVLALYPFEVSSHDYVTELCLGEPTFALNTRISGERTEFLEKVIFEMHCLRRTLVPADCMLPGYEKEGLVIRYDLPR